MTGRAVAETLVALGLTIILAFLFVAVFGILSGESFIVSFTEYAPSMTIGLLWPAYLIWLVFLVISNLLNRTRSAQRKLVLGFVGAIVTAVLFLIMLQGFSFTMGDDWGWVLLTVALIPLPFFIAAAAVSLVITHLVILRPRSAANRLH